jgi:hypothetical protein
VGWHGELSVAWTDETNVASFWKIAHELAGLLPPTPILVVLKDDTTIQGNAVSFTTENNDADTAWQGTLKVTTAPDDRVVSVDCLDILTVEKKGTLN